MASKLDFLLYLSSQANLFGKAKLSTIQISKDLKISQQSVSRVLKELEKEGLIIRNPTYQGIEFSMTENGRKFLEEYFFKLRKLFSSQKILRGKVVCGIGEGGWYVAKYKDKIKKMLDFIPFQGTLNITSNINEKKQFLSAKQPIKIESFELLGRTYGSILLYPVIINKKYKGAIVLPERARHKEDIIEIIAPVCLRKKFNFKDKDQVEVE